jgi:hypothetical protein
MFQDFIIEIVGEFLSTIKEHQNLVLVNKQFARVMQKQIYRKWWISSAKYTGGFLRIKVHNDESFELPSEVRFLEVYKNINSSILKLPDQLEYLYWNVDRSIELPSSLNTLHWMSRSKVCLPHKLKKLHMAGTGQSNLILPDTLEHLY